MKKKLRQYLGVDLLIEEIANLKKKIETKCSHDLFYESKDVVRLHQIIFSLLDYLYLDIQKDLVVDYSRIREPEPMREIVKVIKKKKISEL